MKTLSSICTFATLFLIGFMLASFANDAKATLVGTDVNVLRSFNGVVKYDETKTVVESGRPEFLEFGANSLSLDITADSIRWETGTSIGLYGDAPHFYKVSGLQVVGGIQNLTITQSGIDEITESDFTFGFDWVRINISNMRTVAHDFWEVRLGAKTVDVPAPTSIALLGLALLGLTVSKRVQRRRELAKQAQKQVL
jgi:hypothetical protein